MIELVFVRDSGFYTIECPVREGQSPAEVARDNAKCNPGTLRVEDIRGKVLWSPEHDQAEKN